MGEIGNIDTKIGMLDFHGNPLPIEKLDGCITVVDNLFNNLNTESLQELMGGYELDVQNLYDTMIEETYNILYGDGEMKVSAESTDYLTKLNEQYVEQLRLENINFFIPDVFGNSVDMNWHHIEWGDMAMNNDKIAVLASRDHGKSYYWSNLFAIWKVYRYDANVRDKSRKLCRQGFIFAHTQDKADDYLQIIKDHVEDNDFLKERLFYLQNGKFGLNSRVKFKNGAEIRVKGFGGKVRGFHPGWIVGDDTLDDRMIYSKTQREKSIDYFYSSIRPMLVPGGQIVWVGTPFHHEDLYSTFKPKKGDTEAGKWGKEWIYREYPALFPDGKLLWEDRYSFNEIMGRRKEYGNLRFSRELLCRPIVSESSLFPWDTIKKSVLGQEKYTLIKNISESKIIFQNIVVGADFAKSANVGADYTCFTVWGVDEAKVMHLLYIYHRKGVTFHEQINELKSIYHRFRPSVMVLESNVFQMIYSEYLADTELPIKPSHTGNNKNDLQAGLPGLTVLFEQGKIKFPYGDENSRNKVDLILSEFSNTTFTDKGIQSVSGHDDTVMSTWLARIGMVYGMEDNFDFEMW